MSITFNIYHQTDYFYHQQVSYSHNLLRLEPVETFLQTVENFELSLDPLRGDFHSYIDYFGNKLRHLFVREPHYQLSVVAKSTITLSTEKLNLLRKKRELAKGLTYKDLLDKLKPNVLEHVFAREYLLKSPLLTQIDHALHMYVKESFQDDRSVYESISEFMKRIFNDFSFVSGFTDIHTPVNTVFETKQGVCQDFAHLAIIALRSMGIPTRYMSGYIETIAPEGKEKLFGTDASHAWFSCYLPGHGWFDFDPTNNMEPFDQHITLGTGRDYSDIAPIQGVVFGSGNSHLNVIVDVNRQ